MDKKILTVLKESYYIAWERIKWRVNNPAPLFMSLTQPVIWLLLFSTMFSSITMNPSFSTKNYTSFILPGIIIMLILFSAGFGGISNYYMKKTGVFYRIYISPVKRSAIVLGHIIDISLLTIFEVLILMLLAFLLGVKIQSGLLGVLIILIIVLLTVFFVSCISYILSLALKTEDEFLALLNIFVLPLFFISKALLPIDLMPKLFKYLVSINPLSIVIDCIRTLINDKIDIVMIMYTFVLLIILGSIFFMIALKNLSRVTKKV